MPYCPLCGIALVKKVPRCGLRENLLAWLMIGPYRCQFCSHRFLVIFGRISFSPGREHKRIPVRYPVYFRPAFGQDQVLASGTLHDLSLGGCTIETAVPVPKASCLCLQVQITEQGPQRQDAFGDRKSTRLNSSHVAISYAVFCLKKKNVTA